VKIELVGRVTVRGRLVDLDSGEPIVGMHVSVGPSSGGFFFGGGGGERKEVSDANGEFEVANAPSGEVMVRIRTQNWGGTNDYIGTSIMRTLTAKPATQDIGEITLVKKRVSDQEKVGDLGYKLREAAPDEDWAKRELKIAFVRPGGPAAAVGLKAGDVITSVNGHDVTGEATYKYGALTRAKAGDTVTLGLANGSSVKVVLGAAL
jgi:membrane-associated protease RseP (regulator of RpoE activity)